MKQLIMLVGMPGSGKSTWTKKYGPTGYFLYSTDSYIENKAESLGVSYGSIFLETYKEAEKYMNDQLEIAINDNTGVIWDQTNMNIKTRSKKIARFPDDWEKIAVYFDTLDIDAVYDRMVKERPEKIIPRHVMETMVKGYERPTETEGFDSVVDGHMGCLCG